jgi:hypothetical protein
MVTQYYFVFAMIDCVIGVPCTYVLFFSSHTPEIFCLSETIIWVESGLTFEKSNTPP